jgi:hypothetical protein
MYFVILFLVATSASLGHLVVTKEKITFKNVVKIWLSYLLPLCVGIGGIVGFIAHGFYGSQIATLVGWPSNNPFQKEVAMANLGMAVIGLLCIWMRKGFWVATAVFSAIFLFGAAYIHILQKHAGDYAPYNLGPFVYLGEIVVPFIYLALAWIYAYHYRFFKNSY